MKVMAAGFQAHLDSGMTTLAWCWRIIRKDGAVFGFTECDINLTFDGTTFEAATGLVASEIRASSDLAADAQDAEGALTSARITETDIVDGKWDNADVEVFRVNWANTDQRVLMRRGSIGQLRRGRVAFVAEMRSLTHILGQTVGRTYQSTCDAHLGDARCGINLELAAYKGAGVTAVLSSPRSFTATGLGAFTTGWFAAGTLDWTSGLNTGRKVEVLGHTLVGAVVTITLLDLPVRAIAGADTFAIRAGCDKLLPTCGDKFVNAPNFRGFPHIPGNDAILRFAGPGGGNTGLVL